MEAGRRLQGIMTGLSCRRSRSGLSRASQRWEHDGINSQPWEMTGNASLGPTASGTSRLPPRAPPPRRRGRNRTSLIALGGAGAAAYREEAIANGGRIVGTMRVTGDFTLLPPQPVFKEKETCGESVPDERLVVDPAGHLDAWLSGARISAPNTPL
jgi:hypothetical protein